MQLNSVLNALLRHNRSTAMLKAAHRLVEPLTRLGNPALMELVLRLLGQRELRTVEDIENFHQELGVELGYVPVEPQARFHDTVVGGYEQQCFARGRVSIVAECFPGGVTLLINTRTRTENRFTEEEHEAIDLMLPPGAQVHHWVDLPDSARRYRINTWRGHEMAMRLFALLKKPEQ